MDEPKPVDRSQGPTGAQKKNRGTDPDPEKFKELIKTEQSDDAKKQKKREQQELQEDLDTELESEALQERSSIFSSFMQDDSQTSENLFQSEDGGTTRESSPTSSSSQEDYEQTYFTQTPSKKVDQSKEEPKSIKVSSSKIKKEQTSAKTSTPKPLRDAKIQQTPSTETTKSLASKKKHEESQKETIIPDHLLQAKALTEKTKSTPKAATKGQSERQTLAIKKKLDSLHAMDSLNSDKALQKKTLPETKKKEKTLSTTMNKSLRAKRHEEKIHTKKMQDVSYEEKKKEEHTEPSVAQVPANIDSPSSFAAKEGSASTGAKTKGSGQIQSAQGVRGSGLTGSSKATSYTRFPRQLFSLFQKLVGIMTIESLKGGITKTELTLSMKNSIFNGMKVRLDQYDTNTHSFNLQFYSSPEAQLALIENMASLMQAFKQEKFAFKVNIQNPSLFKEKKIKRVEKSTKKKLQ